MIGCTLCFVGNGPNIARFYEHFIHDSHNIKKVFNMQTEHCMVYIASPLSQVLLLSSCNWIRLFKKTHKNPAIM